VKVNIASGSIHYLESGTGRPLVFLHAFPLNAAMWLQQIEAFREGFRIIAPDLRGFGKSTPASPWTIEDACADLNEFLTTVDVSDCTLIGLSMGGYIGLPFAARFPERIHSLVLADTRARADNEVEAAGRTGMIADIQAGGVAVLLERMLPRLLKPDPAPEAVRTVTGMIEQANIQAAVHALAAMRGRADASAALERLACPVLVIAGDQDVITRVTEGRAMAKAARNGRFVEVPDAGHLSNLENPPAFNQALKDFLAE
jgi:pimeloyl-ACP methyl ester carboxylesterase